MNWIIKNLKDDEPVISFDQIVDMLHTQDNYRVREVHPTKRSLRIIVFNSNIKQQHIPDCGGSNSKHHKYSRRYDKVV